MVRKIDELGRVVIPAETRRLLNIAEGDQLAFSVEGDAVVIRKLEASCVFDGSTIAVRSFRGRGVCRDCREALTQA
jgi:transcriptional pleiotropic regulator of transition state genes